MLVFGAGAELRATTDTENSALRESMLKTAQEVSASWEAKRPGHKAEVRRLVKELVKLYGKQNRLLVAEVIAELRPDDAELVAVEVYKLSPVGAERLSSLIGPRGTSGTNSSSQAGAGESPGASSAADRRLSLPSAQARRRVDSVAPLLYLTGTSGTLPGVLTATPNATSVSKTIAKDGGSLTTQTDTSKFHTWATAAAPASGLVLEGTATLFIGTSGGSHTVTAGLFDCAAGAAAASTTCTLIDSVTSSAFAGVAAMRTLSFGAIDYTIPSGRNLRVKIVNQDSSSNNDFSALWNNADVASRNSRLVIE